MHRKIIIGVCLLALLMGMAGLLANNFMTPTVGICLNSATESLAKALQDTLVIANYNVKMKDTPSSQEELLQQIRSMLDEDVDVLVVAPTEESSVEEILKIALETPVIFIGQEPESLGNAYFAGPDRAAPGKLQAQLITQLYSVADINQDKSVDCLVLSGPEGAADALSHAREIGAVLSASDSLGDVLETVFCEDSAAAAQKACATALSKYGRDLELILCASEQLAMGALSAIRKSGRVPGRDVLVISCGASELIMESLVQGTLAATVTVSSEAIVSNIVSTVKSLAKGRATPQKNYTDYTAVFA